MNSEKTNDEVGRVAGVGMVYYPGTGYALALADTILYEGTRAGFLQWGSTMLAKSNWHPPYRAVVQHALQDAWRDWVAPQQLD